MKTSRTQLQFRDYGDKILQNMELLFPNDDLWLTLSIPQMLNLKTETTGVSFSIVLAFHCFHGPALTADHQFYEALCLLSPPQIHRNYQGYLGAVPSITTKIDMHFRTTTLNLWFRLI